MTTPLFDFLRRHHIRTIFRLDSGMKKSSCLSVLFAILIYQNNIRYCGASATFHEQDLQGAVEAGNYSYYTLKNDFSDGKIAAVVLLLFSIQGDADLYASRSTDKPTYEHGQHDYQSTSCGIDRLDINLNSAIMNEFDWSLQNSNRRSSKKTRPLTVGVYGHPSHPLTRYLLKVLLFVGDKPIFGAQSIDWRLSDDDYMSDEMILLASNDQWRDWVQQVHVGEDDFGDWSSDTAAFADSISPQGRENGDGFGQLMKSVAEILLAILSFALNILVEILA